MDGMLLTAFLFPLVLFGSCVMSLSAFFVSLWLGFGPELAKAMEGKLQSTLPVPLYQFLYHFFNNPPLRSHGYWLYPLLLNCNVVLTVMGTYLLGKILYRKDGWQFAQPFRGGIRFVLLQVTVWTMFAFTLLLPWPPALGFSDENPQQSLGGLLVSAAALGMLCQTMVIVALMSYDSSRPEVSRRRLQLRDLETGAWNWDKMFGQSSSRFWWVFMFMQFATTLYSGTVAFLAEDIKPLFIRKIMVAVFIVVFLVSLAITNTVGGKWRHGEVAFHLYMPFRGGPMFIVFQAVGWISFTFALIMALAKFFGLEVQLAEYFARSAAFLGLHAEEWTRRLGGRWLMNTALLALCSQASIWLSLFFFDPDLAGESNFLRRLESISSAGGNPRTVAGPHRGGTTSSSSPSSAAADGFSSSTQAARRGGAQRKSGARGASSPAGKGSRSRSRDPVKSARLAAQDAPLCFEEESVEVDRIVGKRQILGKADEYLVEWNTGEREWAALSALAAKVLDARALTDAIRAHDNQRLGQVSDDDESLTSDTSHTAAATEQPAARRRSARDAGRASSATRRRSRTSVAEPESSGRKVVNPQSAPAASQEWEECEDDAGNLFYFCVTTGESSLTPPNSEVKGSSPVNIAPRATPAPRQQVRRTQVKKVK